jgi:aspartyl-tRNA(Asn)/glutamyl-tRNA(Gln) amidotransferase subunit A
MAQSPVSIKAHHTLTAAEAASRIADGSLSPVEYVRALLARIDEIDGDIKAWVCIDRDVALAEAAAMEAEAAAGNLRGPLHGIPVALKDVFDAAGMPTRGNSATTSESLVEADSSVAQKLREAGAIILGKVSTVEFAGMGEPATTRNPWNLGHTPGGSSSGSGAAVGARMVPIAIGTQTGGSNLRPAAYNGVSGFKGSYGRIARAGCVPVSYGMDHPGIIARTVEDLAIVFSAAAGPDPRDPTSLQSPPPPADLQLAGLRPPRIGVVRDFFFERSEPAMCAAVDASAQAYVAQGAEVVEVSLPPEFSWHLGAHRIVMAAEAAVVHARRYAHELANFTPRLRNSVEAYSLVPAPYYLQAQRIRRHLRNQLQSLFAHVDVLIMPTAPGPAPSGLGSTGDASLLSPWTFIGYPAASISADMAPNGLPMGLQIVGPPLADYDTLRAAAWCESVTGVLGPPPNFS